MMITFKLKEAMQKRGINQTQLSEGIGIRQGTVSDYVRNSRDGVKFDILEKIMVFMNITDVNELIEFVPNEQ